ncbi:2Fe-2S iron-sulfur cluster-binding protein [Streptomyces sp. NPDC026672]|uniref:2Fe-2S iron-sulfur cluster-binding protein n=1 Tax=unclassified Streptomyces TaxID=2593676 RepID=UPI0033F3EE4B
MTDDQHAEGGTPPGGGRWDPHPQGDYDDGATAFVKLPEGGIDALLAADSPLAAPGHGYVPPRIAASPGGPEQAGQDGWGMPADGSGWPDPNAVPQDTGAGDRFTYPPAATQQWTYEEPAQAAPGHDVTGQWSIPVAGGDLPDESGEFTTSALVEQWGGTPPATLPGGASAPWANEPAGGPWGERPPAHPEDTAPGNPENLANLTNPEGYAPQAPYQGGPPSHGAGIRLPEGPGAPAGPGQGLLPPGPGHDPAAAHAAGQALAPHEAPAPAPHAAPAPHEAHRPHETPPGHRAHPAHDEERPHAEAAGAAPEFAPETDGMPGAVERPAADGTDGATRAADGPAEAPERPAERPAGPDPAAGAGDGPEGAETAVTDDAPEADPAEPLPAPHDDHPSASYVLRVNGADRPVADAWIGESLLYVLRERLGLAGAKDGCSQGECGACNVQVDGRLVASCLVPAVTAAGSEVRTVEGLAVDGQPSDVQRALAKCGAVQCGFCVPGMAMTVHDLLEGNPSPTEMEARQALSGNLCRCSGYRGVLDAVQEVVAEREAHAAADAEADAGEPRIPHQAGPGAGGVNPAAFDSPGQHDQPYGHDGGQA